MVKYTSRVKGGLKPAKDVPKKEMAQKIADGSQRGGQVKIKPLAQSAAPVLRKIASAVRARRDRLGGVLPVGGALADSPEPLDDSTIEQLAPHVFIHMLGNMDMPTYNMVQGIAANFLNMEHPMRKIVGGALQGDFVFPKNLSKIAMRDVLKAPTPQALGGALHSEWLDMMSGKLSREEVGGGLFSSLKTLVKRGVKGARTALTAVGKGAASAVRALSSGAMGAQMIGKSVSNALMQGIEVANALSPVIQTVFPATEGILKSGLGKANAANELVKRGIKLSGQVEQAVAPVVGALGAVDAPIVVDQQPVGAGLDLSNADPDGTEDSGPRFVS
jgi:hypothetical protein